MADVARRPRHGRLPPDGLAERKDRVTAAVETVVGLER